MIKDLDFYLTLLKPLKNKTLLHIPSQSDLALTDYQSLLSNHPHPYKPQNQAPSAIISLFFHLFSHFSQTPLPQTYHQNRERESSVCYTFKITRPPLSLLVSCSFVVSKLKPSHPHFPFSTSQPFVVYKIK